MRKKKGEKKTLSKFEVTAEAALGINRTLLSHSELLFTGAKCLLLVFVLNLNLSIPKNGNDVQRCDKSVRSKLTVFQGNQIFISSPNWLLIWGTDSLTDTAKGLPWN